jgi:hypothetical protein
LSQDEAAALWLLSVEGPFYKVVNATLSGEDRTHLIPYLRLV